MTVVSVEHVSKSYRLGMIGGATLQEDFERLWAKMLRKPDPLMKIGEERGGHGRDYFWALRDVSFQVKEGEVLGIIGRNGAGKSTLLKILSQVTGPTTGKVKIKGRMASLLEVGTGFHPELTGRDNIFLNGAILGMTKAEVRRKLEEIIAFSGVEEFIDTPVKRYSSGMKVRLAFAVAAHLEPEILVIDEVLAVGDAEFQKKCLGKMGEVASAGRTILFVSHDLNNVSRLCQRGILLNKGRVEAAGEIAPVIAQYTGEQTRRDQGFVDLSRHSDRTGNGDARFHSVELASGAGRTGVFEFNSSFVIRLMIDVKRDHGSQPIVAVVICTDSGSPVHGMHNTDDRCSWTPEVGEHSLEITLPHMRLYPGDYLVDLWLGDAYMNRLDYVRDAIRFQVVQTTASDLGRALNRRDGLVYLDSTWTHWRPSTISR